VSVYDRMYVARIAPIKEFHDVARDEIAERFERDAFLTVDPTKVPVVLHHDDEKPVGRLDGLSRSRGWHVASFRLNHSVVRSAVVADWLRPGWPVSIGFRSLHSRTWADGGLVEHTIVELLELTVVDGDTDPVYPGAQIVSVIDLPRRARAVEHRDEPNRVLVRPGSGYVVGVR
jgi:phage head maturation protease